MQVTTLVKYTNLFANMTCNLYCSQFLHLHHPVKISLERWGTGVVNFENGQALLSSDQNAALIVEQAGQVDATLQAPLKLGCGRK